MSWVAHDAEPYVIQKHLGKRVAIVPLLLGSYAPDMATKWFVYGAGVFGVSLKADDPAQFHRGYPGVGFTHSLVFGLAVAALIYAIARSRIWAFSFLIGQWAHALTDTLDTVGTMLFFPFTTELFAAGAWAYAGQTGRYTDAGAYFSGLGFVWDGIWLVWGAVGWRVLTRAYFRQTIVPADPFWRRASKHLPETALLAIYRISFFYGACRWVAWLAWSHLVRSFAFDLSWGGPGWVRAVRSDEVNAARCPCPSCCSASPKLALSLAVAVAGRMSSVSRRRDAQRTRPSILWSPMSQASALEAPELAATRIDARARGENFPVASLLAPRWARPHLRAVYGFARLVDNLGDEAEGDRTALLDELERELEGPPRTEIMRRLHATIAARGLALEPFRRLIEANRIDQRQSRYETWLDVREYCTYSADPVGRLVLGIYGRAADPELVGMSDSVCTGLQLVNFLQDPPRDLALGRVYLPQEDLQRFGVVDRELAGPLKSKIAELLAFEAARARVLLEQGLPLADALGGRAGLSVALYARGGLAALEALERAGWDVFSRRPAPSRWTFARLAVVELAGRR